MARVNSAAVGAFCVSLISAPAAFADVTPEQVWTAWQKGYESYGYKVTTGSKDRSGDTYTISDVTLENTSGDSSFTLTVPSIKLHDNGDGTVDATMSEKMNGVATTDMGEDGPVQLDMVLTQQDSKITVSGTPEDMIYDIDSPKMTVEMDQDKAGKTAKPVKVFVSLEGTKGTYEMKQSGGQDITSNVTTKLVRMSASGADPETSGTFNLSGSVADVSYNGSFVLPEGVSMEELDTALNAGAKIDFQATYGASDFSLSADANEGPVSVKTSAQSGALTAVMTQESVQYGATAEGSKLNMTSQKLPFPVTAGLDEIVTNFLIPVSKSDTAQPYKAKIALKGLTVSDDIWNMFDPDKKLPRDPASLVVDLSGKAMLTADLFSKAAAKMSSPPIEMQSADINALQLTLMGADLRGSGALTFDNSTPVPQPVGTIDLTLTGANALMDNLVASGLVPQDKIMFGRMMLGLYAKSTGDDAVESKVEFKDGGEILVNGQRVQ
ncbi:hypothetical protein DL1_17285 [Thioclava dalianensis]|uniref:DUF2125 domain-containing protein n=1 Tax=Thioclava dalianensis TaxID=1185766 RepID=A0A074U717_9RHOB|nr:DUF2125 domain-containing protein [Thioclava dalianensis]KEP70472.1 hypothetical protein DL1_17285 [Thioclava dalianensis]SFN33668.1 hypothetical protein SAMN05216224_104188 [Thioclava dalianensis]